MESADSPDLLLFVDFVQNNWSYILGGKNIILIVGGGNKIQIMHITEAVSLHLFNMSWKNNEIWHHV